MTEALRTLQQRFLAGMQGNDGVQAHIHSPDTTDAERRFAIYRSSVQHNWRAAMGSIYPVCQAWVGEAFFNEAVRQHLAASPSTSGDLAELGAGFAEFLAHYSPAASQPVLPDLARLEWAVHRAFHAADANALSASALATVPPEDLDRLVLHPLPGSALIATQWPLLEIWKAHQPDAEAALPDLSQPQPQTALVWREGLETALVELDDATAALVQTMLDELPLTGALERMPFAGHAEAGALLGQSLQRIFSLGLVAAISLKAADDSR